MQCGIRPVESGTGGIRYRMRELIGFRSCICRPVWPGPVIAGLFTDSETALDTASMHMRIVPISYAALGVAMVVNGAFNAVAPESVTNADLTRELGEVLKRPAVFPVPAFAIRLLLGEIAGELLDSKRVVPARLEAAGFAFGQPTLRGALEAELL